MNEVYLVGGTTPRTDLENFVSANIIKSNAEKSLKKWEEYQGDYEDFSIYEIEIDDIEEYKKIIREDERAKTIDEFTQRIIDEIQTRQYDREFCKEHHIEVSICTTIATIAIKEIAEQMKGGAE